MGVSIFGVDGASCSSVNEINCTTSAIGVVSLSSVTLSGSDYYYMQVYTLDGSSFSPYIACASATTPSGGGGGVGGCCGVLPTVQDCDGAVPVCQDTYSESNAYSGEGNIEDEINSSSGFSCLGGEKNDVWYIFTTQSAGDICFDITPNVLTDDYDWAVYDITTSPCSDISSNASLEIACNYSPSTGVTGANGGTGNQNESCFSVQTGETYVINVSQFSTSTNGFTIDFSASTADMWDNCPPVFSGVTSPAQGATSLEFNFSENVDCSSIDDSDFTLIGPGGPYTLSGITGSICSLGGSYEDVFTANVSPALTVNGTYDLCLISGAGIISDVCGNQADPACYSFTISSNPVCPVIDPLTPIEDCDQVILPVITGTDLTTGQAYFTGAGGTGTQYAPGDIYSVVGVTTLYAYDGITGCDDEEELVVTVNLTPTITGTLSACVGSTSQLSGSGTPDGTSPWVSSDVTVATVDNSGLVTALSSGTTDITYLTDAGCSVTETFTVIALNTVASSSNTPPLCINTVLTNITHTTTGAIGIANNGVDGANGLPSGVSATWSGNTITISGTQTASGSFPYSIALNGGCGTVNATGTIEVNPILTPTIACGTSTISSVEFTLSNSMSGVTDYDVSYTVNGGTAIVDNGVNFPYSVTGLTAGDVVDISVTANGSGCYLQGTGSCTAQNC